MGSLVLLLSLPLGACSHAQGKSQSPEQVETEREAELAQLRRENAALRNRVQNLEERVRMIEQEGGRAWSAAEAGDEEWTSVAIEPVQPGSVGGDDGTPRQLPVVKLTPKNGGRISAGPSKGEPKVVDQAARPKASVSLSTVPNSGFDEYGEPIDAYGDGQAGGWDEGDVYEPEPTSAGAGAGETASYRLVGSKLVAATKREPVTPTGKKDRDSGVVGAYERAMDVYRAGKYADAEAAFEAIVRDHPNHEYADNALYWQGEAAYDQAHYADALAAFTAVVERYGGGGKAPDALLKIGLCYGRLGDDANARDVLTQLIAAYPRSEASKIAKRKLDEFED